jgi:hypothetical protein
MSSGEGVPAWLQAAPAEVRWSHSGAGCEQQLAACMCTGCAGCTRLWMTWLAWQHACAPHLRGRLNAMAGLADLKCRVLSALDSGMGLRSLCAHSRCDLGNPDVAAGVASGQPCWVGRSGRSAEAPRHRGRALMLCAVHAETACLGSGTLQSDRALRGMDTVGSARGNTWSHSGPHHGLLRAPLASRNTGSMQSFHVIL